MASVSDQLYQLRLEIDNLRARIMANDSASLIYAAFGQRIFYGCKVTEGESATDMIIALEGLAVGDEAHWNPDAETTPMRDYEYANIASLKAAAFYALDKTAVVEEAPATGLGRYDIVYIFVGIQGTGFAISTGTPSTAVKTDFDTNGLDTGPYDPNTDAVLPVGAYPVGRVYVDDTVTGIPNSRIADLREF